MGGRMGGKRITVTNLPVVQVDEANNILYLNGSVPGAVDRLVLINGKGDLKVNLAPKPSRRKLKSSGRSKRRVKPKQPLEPTEESKAGAKIEAPTETKLAEAPTETKLAD